MVHYDPFFYWVVFHPLYTLNNQVFFHGSSGYWVTWGYIGVILRGVFVGYHLLSHHFRNWNIPSFLNFMLPVLIATAKG